MLPHNWKEILAQYRKMLKEDPHAFDSTFAALEKRRCLTVLWGLEEPANINFQDLEDKRHTLLAYKYLEVLWFNHLPETEKDTFEILVRGLIPKTATEKKILRTFRHGNRALEKLCKEVPKPS